MTSKYVGRITDYDHSLEEMTRKECEEMLAMFEAMVIEEGWPASLPTYHPSANCRKHHRDQKRRKTK